MEDGDTQSRPTSSWSPHDSSARTGLMLYWLSYTSRPIGEIALYVLTRNDAPTAQPRALAARTRPVLLRAPRAHRCEARRVSETPVGSRWAWAVCSAARRQRWEGAGAARRAYNRKGGACTPRSDDRRGQHGATAVAKGGHPERRQSVSV